MGDVARLNHDDAEIDESQSETETIRREQRATSVSFGEKHEGNRERVGQIPPRYRPRSQADTKSFPFIHIETCIQQRWKTLEAYNTSGLPASTLSDFEGREASHTS
jgi:hypothetical protein